MEFVVLSRFRRRNIRQLNKIWWNWCMEWFNDSLESLLDESVFLNESLEWMIQWLTWFITGWISVFEWISWMNDSMTHLIHYRVNQCFWMNLLSEWFNDSLISLLDESVFLNESLEWMIHDSLDSLPDESVFLNESLEWMIQWLTWFITGWISVFEWISWMNDSMTHLIHYRVNQCFWMNLLN